VFFVNEFLFSLLLLVGFFFQIKLLLLIFLLGKIGIFPFWYWVIRLFENPDKSLIIIISVYKIVVLLFFLNEIRGLPLLFIVFNRIRTFVLLRSYNNLFKFICFSSLSRIRFLIVSSLEGEIIIWYFVIYCFSIFLLLFFPLNMVGLIFLLFYIGFPPFPSFFIKISIIIELSTISFFRAIILWVRAVFFICCLWPIFRMRVLWLGLLLFPVILFLYVFF